MKAENEFEFDPFEDALDAIDGLDMDAADLSEWLDGQYESGISDLCATVDALASEETLDPIEDSISNNLEADLIGSNIEDPLDIPIDSCTKLVEEEATIVSIDMFDDENHTLMQTSRRRPSRSPPRRRSRQLSPQRCSPITIRKKDHSQLKSPTFTHSTKADKEYNEALSKLAESMKRSELSRIASSRVAPQPSPSTLSSLAGLLTGKRSSLTAGLEHSRRQLRAYMSLMTANQTL